ncbi:hypothetical protein [Streptomyces ortus]|uniref:Uncharacterized protein n=1 Tax=Streptomyces ortus TaxID=2867268 RepID=A0ABT3UWS3_9ACTN|nr:hypothetical protein [Streptomyces ortus]MCX4232027.1 hypothetical protein [Streptomyces ortus]
MSEATVLTSADPEPPPGTRVLDDCGITWINSGYYPVAWMPYRGDGDPESWTKVAGNYGPVRVVVAP